MRKLAAVLLFAAVAAPIACVTSPASQGGGASSSSASSVTPSSAPMAAAPAGALALLPNGTFTATITRADAPADMSPGLADSLSGTWALTMVGTHYTAQFNGADVAAGDYEMLPGSQIRFNATDSGSMACGVAATYHVVVGEHSLVYHKLSDECTGRVMVLTSHPFVMRM